MFALFRILKKLSVSNYIDTSTSLGLIPQGVLAATLAWELTAGSVAEENADAFLQLSRLIAASSVGYGSYSAIRNLIGFFAHMEASELPENVKKAYDTRKFNASMIIVWLRELINLGLTLNASIGFIALGLLGYEQICAVFIDHPEVLARSNSIASALYKVFNNKIIQILITAPLVPIDLLTFSNVHRWGITTASKNMRRLFHTKSNGDVQLADEISGNGFMENDEPLSFKQFLKDTVSFSASAALTYYGAWIFEQLGLSAAEYFNYGSEMTVISAKLFRISVALMWARSAHYGIPSIVKEITAENVADKEIAKQNLWKSLPSAVVSAIPNVATQLYFFKREHIILPSVEGVGLLAANVLSTVSTLVCGNYFIKKMQPSPSDNHETDERITLRSP
jgi:hypothetical protein